MPTAEAADTERGYEIGKDEAWSANLKAVTDILINALARTHNEYQQESLESIRQNRTSVEKIVSDAQQNDNVRQAVANQALQNAVETANMIGKQAVRHGDIAIDNQWNPVQQGAGDTLTARAVSIDDASLKAIGAMVAAAVSSALSASKA